MDPMPVYANRLMLAVAMQMVPNQLKLLEVPEPPTAVKSIRYGRNEQIPYDSDKLMCYIIMSLAACLTHLCQGYALSCQVT